MLASYRRGAHGTRAVGKARERLWCNDLGRSGEGEVVIHRLVLNLGQWARQITRNAREREKWIIETATEWVPWLAGVVAVPRGVKPVLLHY